MKSLMLILLIVEVTQLYLLGQAHYFYSNFEPRTRYWYSKVVSALICLTASSFSVLEIRMRNGFILVLVLSMQFYLLLILAFLSVIHIIVFQSLQFMGSICSSLGPTCMDTCGDRYDKEDLLVSLVYYPSLLIMLTLLVLTMQTYTPSQCHHSETFRETEIIAPSELNPLGYSEKRRSDLHTEHYSEVKQLVTGKKKEQVDHFFKRRNINHFSVKRQVPDGSEQEDEQYRPNRELEPKLGARTKYRVGDFQ